jgi:hypothetical protein
MSLTAPLRMRATVERFTATGTDPDRQPTGTTSTHEIACWLFQPGPTLETTGESVNVLVDQLRMLVRYDADITDDDEVTQVTDLAGAVIEGRRLKVVGVKRRGDGHIGISHRAISLEVVS